MGPGYRPYTLGSGEPAAQQDVVFGVHYYRRKKWWMRAAGILLALWG